MSAGLALSLVARHPSDEGRVAVLAGTEGVDHHLRRVAPGFDRAPDAAERLFDAVGGIARAPIGGHRIDRREADHRVDQDQAVDPLGMHGGEQLRHQAAFRETDDAGAPDGLGIHDGEDVLDALLERRVPFEAIRAAAAPLVELEHSHVARDVLENAAENLLLPAELDVRYDRRDDDHVRARAEALIGDMDIAAAGELRIGNFHRSSYELAGVLPLAASRRQISIGQDGQRSKWARKSSGHP